MVEVLICVEQRAQKRRHEHKPRHLMAFERLDELPRVFDNRLFDEERRDALQERAESFPDGIDETERGLQATHLALGERVSLPHPFEAIDGAAVQADDAFGSAGRARSVDDVSRLVGSRGPVRVARIMACDLVPLGVETDRPRVVRGQSFDEAALREQQPRP